MVVKTVFEFIWGGEPEVETYTDVVKIEVNPTSSMYGNAVLYFRNGTTTEIDYSNLSIEEEHLKC